MDLTRREFLLGTAGTLLSVPFRAAGKNEEHILVLGAGLSGLSAAYELVQKGFRVTVIEARTRVGGRVKTLHTPFKDGQYVELGGELIGDGYSRLINYIQKFRIPYEDLPERFETSGSVSSLQWGTGTTAVMKGRILPVGSDLKPHPYGLVGDEAKGLPPALLSVHLRSMVQEAAHDPQKNAEFDKISLADALRERGVSDASIRLINISLNYNSIDTVSAGAFLADAGRRVMAGSRAMRVIGGNDLIPKILHREAERAGVRFLFGADVRQVRQTGKSVRVAFRDRDGRSQYLSGDKAVCTIPFSVLKNISFSPTLPAAKAKAIKEIEYTRITKVYMQGKRFEWDSRNIGTSVWTDTPLERIFEMAGDRGDQRGIFTVWMDGDGARVADGMSDRQRQIWARDNFVRTLPFMKDQIESTATKSWANDEFARGGYAHLKVGQLIGLEPHVKTPEGNVHFAGEHTAEYSPGMEGALESAERVVAEIEKNRS